MFSVGQLTFIDFMQFMAESLEKLSSNLKDEDMIITKKYTSEANFKMLRKKGIYPYDYVSDFAVFGEGELPPKECFYSVLRGEGISDAEYEEGKQIWKNLGCKKFGDRLPQYLFEDRRVVVGDVFENFRKLALKYYELDPAHLILFIGLGSYA